MTTLDQDVLSAACCKYFAMNSLYDTSVNFRVISNEHVDERCFLYNYLSSRFFLFVRTWYSLAIFFR